LPHAETDDIENIGKLVSRYYDPSTQRFKHPIEIEHAKAEAADKAAGK